MPNNENIAALIAGKPNVQKAMSWYAKIRIDLDEFDGDRRGIAEALNEAEEYGDDGGRKRVATKITGNTADTIIIDEALINPTTSRVTENGLVNDELSENEA